MKEILKKHMHEELPAELRPKKRVGVPLLASSLALLAVVVVSFQLNVKTPQKALVTDKWLDEFDQEIDQEMEVILAELDRG